MSTHPRPAARRRDDPEQASMIAGLTHAVDATLAASHPSTPAETQAAILHAADRALERIQAPVIVRAKGVAIGDIVAVGVGTGRLVGRVTEILTRGDAFRLRIRTASGFTTTRGLTGARVLSSTPTSTTAATDALLAGHARDERVSA